jgi:hypothetical protein
MDAPAWTDCEGRRWSTVITVGAIKRVQQLVDVNLLEVFDGQLLNRLADDPVLLANTLYAVCQPQAEERHIDDVAFGELLVGDAIEEAAEALVRGVASFFPQRRRAALERLWTRLTQARTETLTMATNKLDSPLLEQALQTQIQQLSDQIDQRLSEFGSTSGNSPASSASTPAD